MTNIFAHQPVLLQEVISSLNLKNGDVVLDATVGGGGHAREILKRILPEGRLIGLDADPAALTASRDVLKEFQPRFELIHGNFRDLDIALSKEAAQGLDAVLFDVGVSSYQLDDESRGFSIKRDARLDMRMDPRLTISAYDIVNRLNEKELAGIIKEYGEERYYRKIARTIAEARSEKPIETTHELRDVIYRAIGFRRSREKIDPATRTFQAIRIAVNDELKALEEGIKKAIERLVPGGRIVAISFHSLEDRIVKNIFRDYKVRGILAVITKKPVRPSGEEVIMNLRSRSARLRVAERI